MLELGKINKFIPKRSVIAYSSRKVMLVIKDAFGRKK
jgi:hypothetical protein